MLYNLFMRKFLIIYKFKKGCEIGESSMFVDGYNMYTKQALDELVDRIAEVKGTSAEYVVVTNIILCKRPFLWWYF